MILSTWQVNPVAFLSQLPTPLTSLQLANVFASLSCGCPYSQTELQFFDFFEKAVHTDAPKSPCFFVVSVYCDVAIRGFLMARVVFEKIEIDYVYVDAVYRKQGVAQLLLTDLEEKICSVVQPAMILLEVGEQNFPAIALYKKYGFQPVGMRKNYYKTGENAILFKKILQKI